MRLYLYTLPKLALSAKFLLCLLMVVLPEATPQVVRQVRLYNSCSRSWLRVNQSGAVLAKDTSNEDDGYERLSIMSVDYSGKLKIFAEKAKRFLCFNQKWKLIASKRFRGDSCYFLEEMFEGGFTRFKSYRNQERFIGFLTNGRQIRAKRPKDKSCWNFVKFDREFTSESIGKHNEIISEQKLPRVSLEEFVPVPRQHHRIRHRGHGHRRQKDPYFLTN